MLSEKKKNRCAADRFIVIFCFQNSQANIADAATIKALPAKDNSIGTANGHSNSATIAEAAACAYLPSSSARKAAKPHSLASSNSKSNKRSLQSSKVNLQRALVCIKAENCIISRHVFKVRIIGQAMIYNRSIEGNGSLPK